MRFCCYSLRESASISLEAMCRELPVAESGGNERNDTQWKTWTTEKILDGFIGMLLHISARTVATSNVETGPANTISISWKNVKLNLLLKSDQENTHFAVRVSLGLRTWEYELITANATRTICQVANHLKREVRSWGQSGSWSFDLRRLHRREDDGDKQQVQHEFPFCALTSRCRPAPSL